MDRLRVFLGEIGVVELPGLEDPCQHIEDETIHGTHGRNRRAPLLGSGYEVTDAHFLQESGLIEPRPLFSGVEPEILSVPTKPELVNQGLGCIYEVINVVVLLEMAVHRQIEIHDTIFKPNKQDLGFDGRYASQPAY
ncbi:unnamed protein product [Cuscuta campestris]|uniref:Uncharacterized protein n=1 Tax=Cuscuta campestris TaxID=132261 RepID=A0A484M5U9_9ASTE|nr:unnamed protein product [Cuscuta campestris]